MSRKWFILAAALALSADVVISDAAMAACPCDDGCGGNTIAPQALARHDALVIKKCVVAKSNAGWSGSSWELKNELDKYRAVSNKSQDLELDKLETELKKRGLALERKDPLGWSIQISPDSSQKIGRNPRP